MKEGGGKGKGKRKGGRTRQTPEKRTLAWAVLFLKKVNRVCYSSNSQRPTRICFVNSRDCFPLSAFLLAGPLSNNTKSQSSASDRRHLKCIEGQHASSDRRFEPRIRYFVLSGRLTLSFALGKLSSSGRALEASPRLITNKILPFSEESIDTVPLSAAHFVEQKSQNFVLNRCHRNLGMTIG